MHACRRAIALKRSFSTSSTYQAASASTATYTAPIKPGHLPAYDHALAYIAEDRKRKLEQLDELSKGDKSVSKAQLEKLEVEAWANDPETRWRAKHGQGETCVQSQNKLTVILARTSTRL